MKSDKQPDAAKDSTSNGPLTGLARRVTSVFFIERGGDEFAGPLTELTSRITEPFCEIGKNLRANLDGLLSVVSMPFQLANRSSVGHHWQRIHNSKRILSLITQAEENETKEALESRREKEALASAQREMDQFVHSAEGQDFITRDTLHFLATLSSDASMATAAEELTLQGLVLCRGALEVLCRDCFIAHLNLNPDRVLALVDDPVSKRRFELSKISLETLSAHDFDLSGSMGTILAAQQDLSDVYSIKVVFQALFPSNDALRDALNDTDLRILSLRRNLIVHRRGIIDPAYATATKCPRLIGQRIKLEPNDLKVHLTTAMRTATVILEAAAKPV